MRRVVAMLGHAPALWLVYRESLSPPLRHRNRFAVLLTLLAMALAGLVAPRGTRAWAVLAMWLVGHFAWGLYLFVELPSPSRDVPSQDP